MPTTDSLCEILSEVFAAKAEKYDFEIVAAFFADRPELLREIHEPTHAVILGRRGTGKTMVLKYLSLPSQLHSSDVPVSNANFALDFAGFYLSLDINIQPTVGPEHDENLAPVFGHWFNLATLLPVLDGVERLRAHPKLSTIAVEKFAISVSQLAFGVSTSSTEQLLEQLNGRIAEIWEASNYPPQEATRRLLHLTNDLRKISSTRRFHTDLSEIVAGLLRPIFRNDPKFYFLLDRFDGVSKQRQDVIRDLIQVRQGQKYFVELGVDHPSRLHLSELSTHDYRILDIERRLDPTGYARFAERVLHKRFEAIRDRLKRAGESTEVVELFGAADLLLPALSFQDQAARVGTAGQQESLWGSSCPADIQAFQALVRAKQAILYSGLSTIIALSSGCIRFFIETVHSVLREACEKRHLPTLLHERCVPFDVQDEALRKEVHGQFTQAFPTDIHAIIGDSAVEDAAEKLLRHFYYQFHRSLSSGDPYLHEVTIEGHQPANSEEVLVRALAGLDRLGYVIPDTNSRPGYLTDGFSISRLFSIEFNIPPIQYWSCPVSVDGFPLGSQAVIHRPVRGRLIRHRARGPVGNRALMMH